MSPNECFAIYYTVGVVITSGIAYSNIKKKGKAKENLESAMSDLRVLSGSNIVVVLTFIFFAGIAALLWPYAMAHFLIRNK